MFHPVVAGWFEEQFGAPTDAQQQSWPAIMAGQHTLVAAPTGSGKTLAAFLASIDRLMRQAIEGTLVNETQVIYVSPLKALSNDIRRNLEVPLEEIRAAAEAAGHPPELVRIAVRTGGTPANERQAMVRKPPHILVTTPESLYLLLTGAKSREILRNVRTVIVDEIHALARDKRGSHLTLSLARLDRLCNVRPTRIGLSATQRPIDEIARFLVGTANVDGKGAARCRIIDTGHVRQLDLAIEVPPSELSAVCPIETWQEAYARMAELILAHRSTLVFVNTRRMAERVCHYLEEQLGEGHVTSHHGSLSRETRLQAEEKLKAGELKAIVATASLELGIDIGYIDLVCQIGSPRSIATFLQRVGRAGHALGKVPKGRLFALTRDEMLEAMALVGAVNEGRLDKVEIPVAPLDILAQQIVAAVACDDWEEDALFEMCREAWPFRELQRADFDAVLQIVSEGITAGNRTGAYLHRDRIHQRLRARRSARLAAITSGGAIPEAADYRVVMEGTRTFVGTLNEDFAIETQIGVIFQLGNTSWQVLHVRGGEVTVRDAHGAPATVPFWLGEAPARTAELSAEVSDLRAKVEQLRSESPDLAVAWLQERCGANEWSARQAVNYIEAQAAAIGLIPTQKQVVFERFFDETGGMQLVIHAPFGARINRAWGLALRKCFCRTFDFELQASADDNGIVLSIGPEQSFPIDRLFNMLDEENGKVLLVQALLAVPMFQTRWRWNVTRALAVLRFRAGKKVPPNLQRFRADDLLTAVFPQQTACFEHRTGDLEVPDHPIAQQSVYDCLHEVMDLPGWMEVLRDIKAGRVELLARETREPSPFSQQLVNANVYAFLDDAPLEERRARAVSMRRSIRPEDVRDLGRLDAEAIAQVRSDAWPVVRDVEELHDTLLGIGALAEVEGAEWTEFFEQLVTDGRAARCRAPGGPLLWCAAENWPVVQAALPGVEATPAIVLPDLLQREVDKDEGRKLLVRGRLEINGPTTAARIVDELGMDPLAVDTALELLEGAGFVLRGQFTADAVGTTEVEWCERRLLSRIHRLTLDGLRQRVKAVESSDYFRYLFARHGLRTNLPAGNVNVLKRVLALTEGFEAPAGAWESDLLPARVGEYEPQWLDELCASGEIIWGRLQPPKQNEERRAQVLTKAAPISLAPRADLSWLLPTERVIDPTLARHDAQQVYEALISHGALFFDDLLAATSLLPTQLEDALCELAALGLVNCDGFAAIRSVVEKKKQPFYRRRASAKKHKRTAAYARGGRWSKFPPFVKPPTEAERAERWARLLLERYGVMFRDLLTRESLAPSWRELVAIYRQLEMRGEIRGGRFVSGVAGEQFALGDAVEQLRQLRDTPAEESWQMISAADPLNLIGVITKHARVPATRSNRVLFLNGQPIAAREAREVRWLTEVGEATQQRASWMLAGPPLWRRMDITAVPIPEVTNVNGHADVNGAKT